jgi:hypothetical protein
MSNDRDDYTLPRLEVGATKCCPRCDREGLLSASVPHGATNSSGRQVRGHLPVVLCQSCDADDPAAGPIITFFLVHEQVTIDNAQDFSRLARAWAAQLRAPVFDPKAFETDLAAWEAGDFDDPPELTGPGGR